MRAFVIDFLLPFFCRANDIDAATSAKFRVEQKQREEAKTRKDENTAWNNKVRETFFLFVSRVRKS
jgi:hypothetical protein